MEKRVLKVIFNKRAGDDNSYSTKISLPKKDLNKMGVTINEREVNYEYDEENQRIIITKKN